MPLGYGRIKSVAFDVLVFVMAVVWIVLVVNYLAQKREPKFDCMSEQTTEKMEI